MSRYAALSANGLIGARHLSCWQAFSESSLLLAYTPLIRRLESAHITCTKVGHQRSFSDLGVVRI